MNILKNLTIVNFIFEYGSGSSTLYVDIKFKKYISIETDYNFYKFLLKQNILKKIFKILILV